MQTPTKVSEQKTRENDYKKPVASSVSEKASSEENVTYTSISASPGSFNIDSVKQKWQSFIDEISREKGLTLAPVLKSLILNSLSGTNLTVQ